MRFDVAGVVLAVLTLASSGRGGEERPVPGGKCVSIEILLADAVGPIQSAASNAATSVETTADRIQELEKQGQLESLARIRLVTLEHCLARVQFGERVPLAQSRSVGPRSRDVAGPVVSDYVIK